MALTFNPNMGKEVVPFLQATEGPNKMDQKFEKLKQNYSDILTSGPFSEGVTDVSPEICKVLDHLGCLVMKIKTKQQFICVTGVGTSFVVFARGKNPAGETYLAITHKSEHHINPANAMEALKAVLLQRFCENIEIYIIGGVLEKGSDCVDIEKEFLELSNQYPIKGARFNIAAPESELDSKDPNAKLETLTVLFSASDIVYSKNK